ncbi:MAG: raffinose/stachyose/melibiose transport system substrate-binding protein [Thermomicrobiales bacterium]|nr:raffinose/stachyose/melibiose transport system substrate-binding protein [Thermomicrobiales bacterium]
MVPAVAGLGGASVTSAQDQPTLTMWFGTTGGSEVAECVVKSAIDPFNAQGGAQIEATLQANGWDAVRTALAGGAGPDVVTTPGPSFAFELAKAGQLLALDDVVTQMGWDKSFVPWALDLGKVNGKLYSVPSEIETLVLYYNKTLFEEKGWQAPKTIDEMMTLAAQIKEAGIILVRPREPGMAPGERVVRWRDAQSRRQPAEGL